MDPQIKIVFFILGLLVLIILAVRLMMTAKSDGEIDSDEISKIVLTFSNGFCNMLKALDEAEKKGTVVNEDQKTEFLLDKINSALKYALLYDTEKQMIETNKEELIKYLLENKLSLLNEHITKGEEIENDTSSSNDKKEEEVKSEVNIDEPNSENTAETESKI